MQRYATIVTPAAIERLIKELQTSIDKYRCSWLQEKQEKNITNKISYQKFRLPPRFYRKTIA